MPPIFVLAAAAGVYNELRYFSIIALAPLPANGIQSIEMTQFLPICRITAAAR
jgi:hypothetical protein